MHDVCLHFVRFRHVSGHLATYLCLTVSLTALSHHYCFVMFRPVSSCFVMLRHVSVMFRHVSGHLATYLCLTVSLTALSRRHVSSCFVMNSTCVCSCASMSHSVMFCHVLKRTCAVHFLHMHPATVALCHVSPCWAKPLTVKLTFCCFL